MSSKYSKKRKQLDEDTSVEAREQSRSPSPPRTKKPAKSNKEDDNSEPADSMSIEESNKLRASLGLAPLQTEENKVRETDDGTGEKIYNEDGFEFRHRKPENWADKKKEKELKEKLEISKQKRDVYSKVLKEKGLAESDEDESAASWVEKLKKKQEDAKLAEQRAKMFDELDEDLGVNKVVEEKKAKKKGSKKTSSSTAGLVVGHGREAFLEGDQILVLEDKGVLDDGDEVLINPNLIENEMHKKNVELRKRKDNHRNFDEEVDEFGNKKHFGVLAKYDEELEGVERKQFRLDEKGGVNLEEEKREMEMFKKLKMAGKRLESLETTKYNLASEFYTQDEMVAFRKVKKGKKEKNTRKRKVLKASDLQPVEPAGSSNLGRRRRRDEDDEVEEGEVDKKEEEDGEEVEKDDSKWKEAMNGNGVDLKKLQKLKEKAKKMEEDDEESDEDMGAMNLAGVVIEDDAEDELYSVLARTRKLKEAEKKVEVEDVAKKVQEIMEKHGRDEEMEDKKDAGLFIDSTMEYCRNIGEMSTLDRDDVDTSELKKEIKEEAEEQKKKNKSHNEDDEDGKSGFDKWKRAKIDKELREKERRKKADRGGWLAAGEPASTKLDSDDEQALEEAKNFQESDEDDDEYEPVLGKEVDVSRGVGAMLKLAAQKGYLADAKNKGYKGPSLDHLKNKSRTQIDTSKNDLEDKYMKKLDRLGTTGRGPIQTFTEKTDYKPEVNISYVDRKGREMDAKDAYRELSYKFHGRNPGKKQLEKRANRKDKEERMLKTNSYDTPLGTLSKQLKKQKQLSTPYLVLSGSTDHSSLKKD